MTPPEGWELVVLLLVAVVLFGSSKLPGAARSIGQSVRIFKAELSGHGDQPGRDFEQHGE